MADPKHDEGPGFAHFQGMVLDSLRAAGVRIPAILIAGKQWSTAGRFFRGAWQSAAAWVCVLVLLVNGAVLPIARLFHFSGEPIDWQGLAVFVAGLCGLAHLRNNRLKDGTTT